MDDLASGTMCIGGPFPVEHVRELAQLIYDDGLGPDWKAFDSVGEALEYINTFEDKRPNEAMRLSAYELGGGVVRDLNDFLREWGVPYSGSYGGYSGGWDPGVFRYDPDGRFIERLATEDGVPCVMLGALKDAIAEGTLDALVADLEWINQVPPAFVIRGPLGRLADEIIQTPTVPLPE
jgi:hypothetical protein